ncbi:MAG: hypothetical protein GY811_20905 [Myxococcales bacterium]|nr:hypothetical protein [Myxococcales bacterium]
MKWTRIALLALLASCATAGSDGGDVTPKPDASPGFGVHDAASTPDATPMPDATPIITYDATPPDSGLFCENTEGCGTGECCISLNGTGLCVPGDEIAGVCIPG